MIVKYLNWTEFHLSVSSLQNWPWFISLKNVFIQLSEQAMRHRSFCPVIICTLNLF